MPVIVQRPAVPLGHDHLAEVLAIIECTLRRRPGLKLGALRVISDHLLPGRWDDIRGPSRKELAATLVLALPLDEVSIKVSEGGPTDDDQDLDRPVWAGHVPIREVLDEPVPDEAGAAYPVPAYLEVWTR